ncbi:MAG: type II toxin-antitoxin system VapC family toxin [Candidatus Acidiferrales bacterium]
MSRIFWDTNLFIYLFEDNGKFSESVVTLRERMNARGDQLYTSTLTVGEILVKPMRQGDARLVDAYKDALARTAILLTFTSDAAIHYASIRTDKSIKAPDALQLSCAAQSGMDLFITNDRRLAGKIVPGIQFIVPLNAAYL